MDEFGRMLEQCNCGGEWKPRQASAWHSDVGFSGIGWALPAQGPFA
jgi:hypothetical protein